MKLAKEQLSKYEKQFKECEQLFKNTYLKKFYYLGHLGGVVSIFDLRTDDLVKTYTTTYMIRKLKEIQE